MSSRDRFVNLATKRLMGLQDFRERFLNYLAKVVRDVHQTAYGLDGVFGGTPITLTAFGANRIQLSANHPMTSDGAGHFLQTDTELAGRDIGIQFENTNTIPYYIGLHYAERPRGIQPNTNTTLPEFIEWEETIGERADPNSVVNNGNGTLTIRVDTVAEPFGGTVRTHAGRRCLVWKKAPGPLATTEGMAIESLIVTFSGGQNLITTTTLLGQPTSSVSTSAADYYVLMLGPTVSRGTNLEVQPSYMFVGTVTGNGGTPSTFDTSNQNDLSSGFAVDLNEVTRLDSHGDLKLRVRADALDTNEMQAEVQNTGGTSRWFVDENGDQTNHGEFIASGNDVSDPAFRVLTASIAIGKNTATFNIFTRGNWLFRNSSGVDTHGIDTQNGIAAFGGVVESGIILKSHGRTRIGTDHDQLHDLYGILRARDTSGTIHTEIDSETGHAGFGGSAPGAGNVRVRSYMDAQFDRTVIKGTTQLAGTADSDATTARDDLGTLTHDGYALISRWRASAGNGNIYTRLFAINLPSGNNGYAVSINANRINSTDEWAKDVSGRVAIIHEFVEAQHRSSIRLAANNANWTDWDNSTVHAVSPGDLSQTDSNTAMRGTFSDIGSTQIATNALCGVSRFQATIPSAEIVATQPTYVLLDSATSVSSGVQGKRLYFAVGPSTSRNGYYEAINARWNPATALWVKDVVGLPAILQKADVYSSGGLTSQKSIAWQVSGANNWADNTWIAQATVDLPTAVTGAGSLLTATLRNARVAFTANDANGGNPVSTAGFTNTLMAKSFWKAWALIDLNVGTVVVRDGMNVASVAITGSSPTRVLTFTVQNGFTDADNWGGGGFVSQWSGSITGQLSAVWIEQRNISNVAAEVKLSRVSGGAPAQIDVGAAAVLVQFLWFAVGAQ